MKKKNCSKNTKFSSQQDNLRSVQSLNQSQSYREYKEEENDLMIRRIRWY